MLEIRGQYCKDVKVFTDNVEISHVSLEHIVYF